MPHKVLSRSCGSLILYHGTAEPFSAFDPKLVGSKHVDIIREAELEETVDPTAFYFTSQLPHPKGWGLDLKGSEPD